VILYFGAKYTPPSKDAEMPEPLAALL